jgi:beta-N-acetylhexosaminidase
LSGAAGANGKLPVSAGPFKFGQGLELAEKKTLRFGNPETSGFDSKKLDKIDDVAKWAIQIGATPGCQILVAKDGEIVYNKSFGKQKYIHSPRIDADNIYDVASITKIAATTIAVMKLYEEGKIDLNQPVKKYIPAYDTVGVGNLIIKDILAHHSGLPGWIPFYQKTLAESVYNNWYQSDSSEVFCVRVADDLFICKDSTEVIWRTIGGLSIKQNQGYKYSDIGFYLLKRMVVEITGMGFEQYLNQTFYEPMNLHRIGFMPERRFPREKIVPTENDRTFRKQEVLGYVHDPGAAMLGGVSGHAGLFSNAKDLAAIMHMLLNEGEYNGIKFLKKETIDYFNTVHFTDSRRGLGFDKPALKNGSSPTAIEASPKTFGHTGFTGTCAWADPEHNLVYIFLSNRTFPDAENNKLLKENIRTDIHSLIYKAMISE